MGNYNMKYTPFPLEKTNQNNTQLIINTKMWDFMAAIEEIDVSC